VPPPRPPSPALREPAASDGSDDIGAGLLETHERAGLRTGVLPVVVVLDAHGFHPRCVGVVGCSGGVLLSHDLSVAVPSALEGLASGFGMGPGVSPPL
jgi:hypothetical protein